MWELCGMGMHKKLNYVGTFVQFFFGYSFEMSNVSVLKGIMSAFFIFFKCQDRALYAGSILQAPLYI